MMTRKSLSPIGWLVLCAAMIVPSAQASESNQGTWMTFDQPVQIPGTVLPAGKYWFRIMDDKNTVQMNIIEIYDQSKNHLATVSALPTENKDRAEPRGYTELQFTQGTDRRPAALLAWSYPGRFDGHRFVYPDRERRILSEEPPVTVAVTEKLVVYQGKIVNLGPQPLFIAAVNSWRLTR